MHDNDSRHLNKPLVLDVDEADYLLFSTDARLMILRVDRARRRRLYREGRIADCREARRRGLLATDAETVEATR